MTYLLASLTILVSLIYSTLAGCPHIITRDDWGARLPTYVDYNIIPVQNVIIHHTVTSSCNSISECSDLVISMQNYHMDNVNLDFGDIGYNFLIGGDGNIYEGRGWHKRGAHTYGYNYKSVGIAFIGDYTNTKPTQIQIEAAQNLLDCGVELGELTSDYKLFGARQVSPTESPGVKLYNEIQRWNNFATPPKK